jgi:hypothetical protein
MNKVFSVFIGLCKQPYSEGKPFHLVITILSPDLGVKAPERRSNKRIVQFCRVQPKEPDLWPHVLGPEGELEYIDIYILSLRVKTS